MEVGLTSVVRYWDLEPHEIPILFQDLKARGIAVVGAWVPWADLESDQNFRLRRFLTQAIRFQFKVRLSVTPEVAIGFPNGGVPNDLLRKAENIAQDRSGQPIYSFAPPNMYPLVNLVAPQVFQRFGHFLLKLSQEVKEVLTEHFDAEIDLIVGDSFFKHYRTLGLSPEDHGDYASLYFQKELDAIRGWNPAQSERTFRVRAVDFLQSRFERHQSVNIEPRNFCVRSGSLERLLDEIVGSEHSAPDYFSRFYHSRDYCNAIWCDDLSTINELGLKFVVSSGMMLYGDFWLPAEDLLRLSPKFLSRLGQIGDSLSGSENYFDQSVLCMVKNPFSVARVSQILREKLGLRMSVVTSLFDVPDLKLERTKLLFVEEALEIENDQFRALIEQTKQHNYTLALFRSSPCQRSQAELPCFETFKIKHDWEYEVALFPEGGQLLIIDGHESTLSNMEELVTRILAVAKAEPMLKTNSKRVLANFICSHLDKNFVTGFLFNPSDVVEELQYTLPRTASIRGIEIHEEEQNEHDRLRAEKRVIVQVPPYAVVPVLLQNMEFLNSESQRQAKLV